jgi:HEAT repeat protein
MEQKDPLVRETAIETLFAAAGPSAIAPVENYLKSEIDPDILYTVLRKLGETRSAKSQKILESYFDHENEDLVIAAVEGAANVAVGSLGNKLIPLLEDKRWRVRVAALEAIKEKGGSDPGLFGMIRGRETVLAPAIAEAVMRCLDDSDEFVRHTAAVTLGELKVFQAEQPLKNAYKKHEGMHGVIIGVLIKLAVSVPDEFIEDLFGPETDDLLSVLDSIKRISSSSRPIVYRAAESADHDVSCSALRVLAGSEKRNHSDNKLLVEAVKSGSIEKQLTVIQEFDLGSDNTVKVRKELEQLQSGETPDKIFSTTSDADVLYAVSRLMENPETPELARNDGIVLLCRFGHAPAFREAEKKWPDMTSSMKATVAESLSLYGTNALRLFNLALDDDNSKVWREALGQLKGSNSSIFVESFSQYLLSPSSRLKPSIAWSEGLDRCALKNPKPCRCLLWTSSKMHPTWNRTW